MEKIKKDDLEPLTDKKTKAENDDEIKTQKEREKFVVKMKEDDTFYNDVRDIIASHKKVDDKTDGSSKEQANDSTLGKNNGNQQVDEKSQNDSSLSDAKKADEGDSSYNIDQEAVYDDSDETEDDDDKGKKDKKPKGCLRTMIYIVSVVFVAILLAVFLMFGVNDIVGIVKEDKVVSIDVSEGASTKKIAEQLKEKGVIKYPLLFRLYSKVAKADGTFQYGTCDMNPKNGYAGVIDQLQNINKYKETIKVTITEGETVENIAKTLEIKKICNAADFLQMASNPDFDNSFVKDIPDDDNIKYKLEGYLFPDTYDFYEGEAPETVIKTFLANLDKKFTPELVEKAKEKNMSTHDVLTLASVVQAEAGNVTYMPDVASVFENRLNNQDYGLLQSCATINYVLASRRLWLTNEDLENPSPYNTYKNRGLPPGPIGNPGINAIKAVINPSKTDYYFFCSNNNNLYYFANTNAQHNANVKKLKQSQTNTGSGTGVTE